MCAVQIQFRGDGPLGGILAVADTKGQVKGKVRQRGALACRGARV